MIEPSFRIGVLGVGHLISYLVPGLLKGDDKPDLLLSPRNRKIAEALAHNHGLEIASSNCELVKTCDVVILSVRPTQANNALMGLPWRAEQVVLSLCAGVSIAEISAHTNGATIIRALPVTAACHGESPTSIYPRCEKTVELFTPCGPVIVLDNEDQFEAASMFGAYYGWIQQLIAEMNEWAQSNGLSPDASRLLASQMTRAAATIVRNTPEKPVQELVTELCLPGSITGLGLESLNEEDAFTAWHLAGDKVLKRLRS